MKTQAQIDASNQYAAYRQGWVTGARTSAMDPKASEHENPLIRDAYQLGYKHGQLARDAMGMFAQSKYGHVPNVLRLQDS